MEYLDALREEAGRFDQASIPELAKTAGVKLGATDCPKCGRGMEKVGSIQTCECGMMKTALNMPHFSPNMALLGGALGAGTGAIAGGKDNRLRGALTGGGAGALASGFVAKPMVSSFLNQLGPRALGALQNMPPEEAHAAMKGIMAKAGPKLRQATGAVGLGAGGIAGLAAHKSHPDERPSTPKEEARLRLAPNKYITSGDRMKILGGAALGVLGGGAAGRGLGYAFGGRTGAELGEGLGMIGGVGASILGNARGLRRNVHERMRDVDIARGKTPQGPEPEKTSAMKDHFIGMAGISHERNKDGGTTTHIPINRKRAGGAMPAGPSYDGLRKDLLPSLPISPTVRVGPTGASLGLRINRKPDSVPGDSVIGQGLKNQNTTLGSQVKAETPIDKKRDGVKTTDTKKQDMLLGHEKLNPEAYRPAENQSHAGKKKLAISDELAQAAHQKRLQRNTQAFENSFTGAPGPMLEHTEPALMRNVQLNMQRQARHGAAYGPMGSTAAQATDPSIVARMQPTVKGGFGKPTQSLKGVNRPTLAPLITEPVEEAAQVAKHVPGAGTVSKVEQALTHTPGMAAQGGETLLRGRLGKGLAGVGLLGAGLLGASALHHHFAQQHPQPAPAPSGWSPSTYPEYV